MTYAGEVQAHDIRIRALFDLYNDRAFDAMLAHYADDVVCFMPTVIDIQSGVDLRWSRGKDEYRRHLDVFRDYFGSLTVLGVFATPDGSSVIVQDELGNPGTFSFEVTPERLVRRVFFHHRPLRMRDRTDGVTVGPVAA